MVFNQLQIKWPQPKSFVTTVHIYNCGYFPGGCFTSYQTAAASSQLQATIIKIINSHKSLLFNHILSSLPPSTLLLHYQPMWSHTSNLPSSPTRRRAKHGIWPLPCSLLWRKWDVCCASLLHAQWFSEQRIIHNLKYCVAKNTQISLF